MLIYASVSYYLDNRQIIQQIKHTSGLMCERLSNSLWIFLWNFDKENAGILINNEMKYEHVQAILVNTYYKDLFVGRYKYQNNIYDIKTNNNLFQSILAENYFKVQKEIWHKNPVNTALNLGTVEIYFTDIFFKQKRNQAILKIMWQTILLTIIIISVFIISLKIMILDRLKKLNELVINFSEKKNQSRIIIKSNDEIGQLNRSFDTMINTIQKYSNYKEDVVEKRTLELREKNEQLAKTNKHLKQELLMAQRVQNSIIPKKLPNNKFLSLHGLYLPMEELGGDYYDVFQYSETCFGLVIADVSGHGLSAAMIASMVKVVFDNFADGNSSTNHVVKLVNNELCHTIGSLGKFVTLFFGIIDMIKGEMEYTNAGHYPIFIVKNDKTIHSLNSQSLLVASFDGAKYKSEKIQVNTGDRIFLYTDGIPETRNRNNEIFGLGKLKKIICSQKHLPAVDLINKILQEITNYRDSEILEDDVTVLIADIKKLS